jgi:hypothetical protein
VREKYCSFAENTADKSSEQGISVSQFVTDKYLFYHVLEHFQRSNLKIDSLLICLVGDFKLFAILTDETPSFASFIRAPT